MNLLIYLAIQSMVEAIDATVRKYAQEELEETRDDSEHVEREKAGQRDDMNVEPCFVQTDSASVSPCKGEMPAKQALSLLNRAVTGKSSASGPSEDDQQTGTSSRPLSSSQLDSEEKTSAEVEEPSSEPEYGLLDSSCGSPAGGFSDDDSVCLPSHQAASPGKERAPNSDASVAMCLSPQQSSASHETPAEQLSLVRRTSPRRKPTSPNQPFSHSVGKEAQHHSPRNSNSPKKTFGPSTVHPMSSESLKENKHVEKTSPLKVPADLRKSKTSFSPKQRCKQTVSSPISKHRHVVPGRNQSPTQHNDTLCRVSPRRRTVPHECVSYSSRLRSSLQKSESPAEQKSMHAAVFRKRSSQSPICLKSSKQTPVCDRQRTNRRAWASELKILRSESIGKPLRTRSRSSSLRMERSNKKVRSSSLHDTPMGRNTPGKVDTAADRRRRSRELSVTLSPSIRRTRCALADKLSANLSYTAEGSEIRGTSGAKATDLMEVDADRNLLSTGHLLSSAHRMRSDASVSCDLLHADQAKPSSVDVGIQVSFMEVESSLPPLSVVHSKSDVCVQTSDLSPLMVSPALVQSPLPCMCPCSCGARDKSRLALQPDQSFMSLTSANCVLTLPSNSASSPDVQTFAPSCSQEESVLANISITSHVQSRNDPQIQRCGPTDLETPCEMQNSCMTSDMSKIIASDGFVADILSSKLQQEPVATSLVSAVVPPGSVENAHDASSSMLSTFPPTPSPSLSYAADNTAESIIESCLIDTALSPSSSSSGKNSSHSDAEKPNPCVGGTESQPNAGTGLYEHCTPSRIHVSELSASVAVSTETTSESVKLKTSVVEPLANLSSTKFNVIVSLPRALSDISSCSESPRYKLRSPRPTLKGLKVSPRTNHQQLSLNESGLVSSVVDSSRNRSLGCELLVCIDKRATDAFLTSGQSLPSFNSSRNTPRRNSSDSDEDDGVDSCIPKDDDDDDDQSVAEDAVCEFPDESHNEKVDVDKIVFASDKYEGMSQDYNDLAMIRKMPASDSVSLCNASFSDTPSSPVALDICVIDSDRDVIIIDEEEGDGSNRWNRGRDVRRGNIRRGRPNSTGQRGRKRKRRHKSTALQSLGAHCKDARLRLESDCVVMLDRTIVPEVLLSHGVSSQEDPHIGHDRPTADPVDPSSNFQVTDDTVSVNPISAASSAQDTSIDLNEAFNFTDLENNLSNCSRVFDVEHNDPLPEDRLTKSQLRTRDSLSSETWNEDNLNSEYDPLPSMKKKRRRHEEDMGYSQRRKKRRRRLHSNALDTSLTDNETDRR